MHTLGSALANGGLAHGLASLFGVQLGADAGFAATVAMSGASLFAGVRLVAREGINLLGQCCCPPPPPILRD